MMNLSLHVVAQGLSPRDHCMTMLSLDCGGYDMVLVIRVMCVTGFLTIAQSGTHEPFYNHPM